MSERTGSDIEVQIAGELYTALERLGADVDLLGIVGSWRDTLTPAVRSTEPQRPNLTHS